MTPTTNTAAARTHTPTLSVYDPPMCCSTGVCGPEIDPALVRFAADLKWLQAQGVEVRRFGLAQNPAAFVENEVVRNALTKSGEAALPLVLIGETVAASGRYPTRAELTALPGLSTGRAADLAGKVEDVPHRANMKPATQLTAGGAPSEASPTGHSL